MSSLIDDYLAQLRQELQVGVRAKKRILWEIEDHLREAAARFEQRGLAPDVAARQAIARCGPPALVAQSFEAEASEHHRHLARRTFMLALTEFAMLCIALSLLTLYLDSQMQPSNGLDTIEVSPHILIICYYISICCAALLFMEALALFLFSLAREEGPRWHLLSLVPLGLGIWFVVLAQRVQAIYQVFDSSFSGSGIRHSASPAFFFAWQMRAAQSISDIHALGAVAAGFTLLLLVLAWIELRFKPAARRRADQARAV
jgi:hypothetical protein